MRPFVLGTRGSKLALAQSGMIAADLQSAHAGLQVTLETIVTKGDRVLDVALSAVGDKGLFVKELEQALLDETVDLCVHSCKDLPSAIPDGLTLAAFPPRADPRDALIVVGAAAPSLSDLPHGAVVGTSSLRRAAQLRALRPDLDLRDVRGNVDTRLRKLAEGQYAALILAAAGLDRLGLAHGADHEQFSLNATGFALRRIDPDLMLPAVAQGILAIETRAAATEVIAALAALDDPAARAAALAERAFLRRLEGGCQVPIAAYATLSAGELHLRGLVAALDGSSIVRGARSCSLDHAEALGTSLAEDLLNAGADAILNSLRTVQGA